MTKVTEFKPIVQDNDFLDRLETLTEKEKRYFSLMRGQFLVPFIKSKPGVGKTSILRTIAEKLGMDFKLIILSMIDESDLQFPYTEKHEELGVKVSHFAVPYWAVEANKRPTMVVFDELNRAPLAVRNAALTMFLDRQIGHEFKFNDNVFFAACGNLGEDDDTDVDVFDAALNNRLIHVDHYLELEEWMNWGKDRIHPDILSFLENNSEVLYTKPTEDEGSSSGAFASPRTWEGVSEFIIKNFGGGPKLDREGKVIEDEKGRPIIFSDGFETDEKGNIKTYNDIDKGESITKGLRNWGNTNAYKQTLSMVLPGIVGSKAASKFIRFLEDKAKLTLSDILNDFAKKKSVLKTFKNDKYFELISEAKNAIIPKWSIKQSDNFVEFLKECNHETRLGFILDLIDNASVRFKEHVEDNEDPIKTAPVLNILNSFKEDLNKIKDLNETNRD